MTENVDRNAGPVCVKCSGTGGNGQCPYCNGQGRVQSLDQWVAAGQPKTKAQREKYTERSL